ncbi:NADP-dependent oxidoreductase [Microbispora hainanensis]|jgi:NADPH:quinone reductase-like Zn-dependent oxidoreductase|uniref:NADP-dependent oxidoreductase n=1 Tax=Microbispora hainanensis TaxID=568844 RepID=A0ABZ1SP92_9ACTN|nr:MULTISPECIES: NADP-dependent oxidoreductase [Microbispora]
MPTMKAVRMHRTGDPEVLALEEVPRPEPGPGDVLVRVHAAGMNPPDWYARIGFSNIPEEMRPAFPLPYTPGSDISGVVVAVGEGVGEWREGDEVFGLVRFPGALGNGGRGYAEYTTSPASHLARKPASLSHVEAAAVPMAGLTAYQFVFDHIKLGEGRRVLVNGAAGGVGHFAAQLAKLQGAYVIGVASGRHETFLRELGVDEFVDYTTTRVEDAVRDVDVLIDSVGGPDAHRFLRVVRPGGVISPVFHGEYHRDHAAELGITFRGGQVHSDGKQMAELGRLLEEGRLRVGIDAVFPLAEAAKAHERAERGHIQGKLVLQVVPDKAD